jgi:hypothetical protein
LKRRIAVLAIVGIWGAFAFATPGTAGSGNGDGDAHGDAYTNQFDDITTSRVCSSEGADDAAHDTIGYAGPSLVWPPNHKLASASTIDAIADLKADGTYDKTEDVSLTTTVTSDELANGTGDGNTATDADQAEDSDLEQHDGTAQTQHQVRAERSGNGDGRVYTIDYTAVFEDEQGNDYVCTSIAADEDDQTPNTDDQGRAVVRPAGGAFTVTVPHDMGDPAVRNQRNRGS